MKRLISAEILLGAVLLTSNSCQSERSAINDGAKQQQVQLLGEAWQLVGSGDYTYIFFRVYNVKLYAKTNYAVNTTVPKIIKLDYLRNIEADVSRKANNKAILLNTNKEGLAHHQDDWDKMNTFIKSIAANQSLIIKHDANGLTLYYPHLNKTLIINNVELAQHYVDIWLGDKTIDSRLRKSLLQPPKETL